MRASGNQVSRIISLPMIPTEVQQCVMQFHAYKHTPQEYYESLIEEGSVSIGNGKWYVNHESGARADALEGMREYSADDKSRRTGFSDGPAGRVVQKAMGINPDDKHAQVFGTENVLLEQVEDCFIYSMITHPTQGTQDEFGPTVKITDLKKFKCLLDTHMKDYLGLADSLIIPVYYAPESIEDNPLRMELEHPAFTKNICFKNQSEIRLVWKSNKQRSNEYPHNIVVKIAGLKECIAGVDSSLVDEGRICSTDFGYDVVAEQGKSMLSLSYDHNLRI